MSEEEKSGKYIEKFLKRANRAIDEGIQKADDILDDAVEFGTMTAKQATKVSKDIHTRAVQEKDNLTKSGTEKFSNAINNAKKMTASTNDQLVVLERLGQLRNDGIITEEEFQEKKKKILDKI